MIDLIKDYRIDNTRLPEIILQYYKKVIVLKKLKPTGEIRYEWTNIGYFDSLAGLFNALLNIHCKKAESLEDMKNRIKEIQNMLSIFFTVKTGTFVVPQGYKLIKN